MSTKKKPGKSTEKKRSRETTSATTTTDSHTIVFVQLDAKKPESRTYLQKPGLGSALESICQLYESSRTTANTDYTIVDVFDFIDKLPDLSMVVASDPPTKYIPKDKHWIKNAMYQHFKPKTYVNMSDQ